MPLSNPIVYEINPAPPNYRDEVTRNIRRTVAWNEEPGLEVTRLRLIRTTETSWSVVYAHGRTSRGEVVAVTLPPDFVGKRVVHVFDPASPGDDCFVTVTSETPDIQITGAAVSGLCVRPVSGIPAHQPRGVTTPVEASEIAEGVFVGRHAAAHEHPEARLVACAHDLQYRPQGFRGELIGCPLHDNAFRILDGEAELAVKTARDLASSAKPGENLLFTCREGLNRSAWVAGLLLVQRGLRPDLAAEIIQWRRPGSLYNWFFLEHLLAARA
jgi:hypothetical protein